MSTQVETNITEKFVNVGGLKTRYLEVGHGPAVILIHGASLGSSADVWRRNLAPLADYGLRVIAYDQPGFGLTDDPPEWGIGFRADFITKFMDSLGLARASLVGHSQAGGMVIDLALSNPDGIERVVILGTGSLLPPSLDKTATKGEPVEGEEGGNVEPTLADVRAVLEHNLSNHALITDHELEIRMGASTGKNHRAFLARNQAGRKKLAKDPQKKPLWKCLGNLTQPLLMIYGRDDRAQAAIRAEVAKQQCPSINLHVVPNCKHLVQWDAAHAFHRLAGEFLRG